MSRRHAQADKGDVKPGPPKHAADVGYVPGDTAPSSGSRVHVGHPRGDVGQLVGLRPHARHQRDRMPGRHQHLAELGREVARAVAWLNLVETDGDVHSVVFGNAAARLSSCCHRAVILEPVREVAADERLQVEDILPIAFGQFSP